MHLQISIEFIFFLLLLASILGALITFWWGSRSYKLRLQEQESLLREQINHLEQQLNNVQVQNTDHLTALNLSHKEVAQLQERCQRITQLESILQQNKLEAQQAQECLLKTSNELTALRSQHLADQTHAKDKLQFLEQARNQLAAQFEQLANTILEEKSQRFAQQNQTNLTHLLNPLKMRLQEFQQRVEHFYDAEGRQRAALGQQVHDLLGMNKQLSEEAHHLATALKGSTKTQGNWGEVVLERILEQAGLRLGQDYSVQTSFTREDERRARPDLIINLPDSRHIILDSKVSLNAYENYVRLEANTDKKEREIALRKHIDSMRAHIRDLAKRDYHKLHELTSLDFVMMFIPIEPAFMLAMEEDDKISEEAWRNNVLLVSPSTLLFVLRTIAHLWRQEAQNRNALDIARRGGDLYDKLVGFVIEMEKVEKLLERACDGHKKAFQMLSSQRDNVLLQAEKLRDLGVKPSKNLPKNLLHPVSDTNQDEAIFE